MVAPDIGYSQFTEDQLPSPAASARTSARAAAQADAGAAAVDAALTLHSRASSTKKFFLDFDGFILAAGTAWDTKGGMSPGTFAGFSTDGAGSPAFSTDDLTYITTVWRIVAEKYSPFDVDVTTETQTDAALTKTSGGDTAYGTHVVFTDDQTARAPSCPVNGCAGLAWIGVFNIVESLNEYEPAWVYTTLNFGSGDVQQTAGQAANSAAHEIGHTLGLDHDSTTGNDGGYYGGHDNWSPIMGSSNRAVQQFNNGGYPNALTSSFQKDPTTGTLDTDDFDVMNKTGAGPRTDDVAGTSALGAQTSYVIDGVIATPADTDTFSVDQTCVKDLTATATGIGMGQTLDIKLTVSGPGVTVSDDPTSGASAGIPNTPTGMDATETVAGAVAGTWTITVEGVGVAGGTGYPDYGSVGQYHLTITGCNSVASDPPGAPATVTATPTARTPSGNLSWTAPSSVGSGPITGYVITGLPGGTVNVGAAPLSMSLSGLTPGVSYNIGVAAKNAFGTGTATNDGLRIDTWVPTTPPPVAATVTGTSAKATWSLPTVASNPGKAVVTGWTVRVLKSGVEVKNSGLLAAGTTNHTWSALPVGNYQFELTAHYTADDQSGLSPSTRSFSIKTVPTAPKIGTPSSGATGGSVNAVARWAAPTSTGNSAITGYRVIAYKSTISGSVISATISKLLSPSARSYTFALPAGRYKFRVVAYNAIGRSPYSAYSALVFAR